MRIWRPRAPQSRSRGIPILHAPRFGHRLRRNMETARELGRRPRIAVAQDAEHHVLKRRQPGGAQALDHQIVDVELEQPQQKDRSWFLRRHRAYRLPVKLCQFHHISGNLSLNNRLPSIGGRESILENHSIEGRNP